jgi:hypothetical protein
MSTHNGMFVDILPVGPPNSSASPITPTDGHFDVHPNNNLALKSINLSDNMETTTYTSNNQSAASTYNNPQITDMGIPFNYPYLINNYSLYRVPNQTLERNDLVQPIFVPQQSSLPEEDCSLISRSAAENTQAMLDCSSSWQMETKDDVYQLRFIPEDINRMSPMYGSAVPSPTQAFDQMSPLVGYQVKFEDISTNVAMVNDYSERVGQDFRQPPTPSSAASPGPASPTPVSQKPPVYTKWTEEEDELLRAAISMYGPHKWSLIAAHVPNRTPMQCSTRWLGALNPTIHKGRWTPEEDAALKEAVAEYINALDADGNPQPIPWNKIATRIPHRTGIQCQARWSEALDPRVRKGKWSSDEDDILKEGVKRFGRCWIRIAEMINGRTQRQCRTRWVQIQNKQAKQDRDARSGGTQATSISSSPKSETSLSPLSPPKTTPPTPSKTMSSAKILHSNLADRSQTQIGNRLTPTMASVTPITENGKTIRSLNSMLKVQSVRADSPQMAKNGLSSRTDVPLVSTIQNGDQLSMFVGSYPFQ